MSACGGGYLPHRFSKESGYDNPSTYCDDLYATFEYIASVLSGAPHGGALWGDPCARVGLRRFSLGRNLRSNLRTYSAFSELLRQQLELAEVCR